MSAAVTRFGAYELERKLGRGGMAETFVARRAGPGQFSQSVCVKRILPTFAGDRSFIEAFNEEARVSAGLRHANIATVLDFGVVDGLPYLALELVDGIDLYGLLEWQREREAPLTSGLVAFVAAEVASALDFAHSQQARPVVHRDVSPSNVLLSRAGEVKLTDFGIARVLRASGDPTQTGTIKGKVPYLAPEYALSGSFDARADLFALGVTLYEMLAGARPYDGRTDLDTLHRTQSGVHRPLAEASPGAPAALIAVIERLIIPDPSQRYPSASALLDALAEIAPPPTARKILGDLVRRAAAERKARAVIDDADGAAPSAAGAPERTRTRPSQEAPATEVLPPRALPEVSDPAMTRTALAPEVLSTLWSELGPTLDERAAVGVDHPEVRNAIARDTAARRKAQLARRVGAAAGVVLVVVLVAVAIRLFG